MRFLIALLSFLFAVPAAAQDWQQLEQQDLRLARIAEHIMITNEALCRSTMPVTGMILHSMDQYSSGAAADRFANGELAIAAVLPGSAAELAGLERDDGILAINGRRVADLQPEGEGHVREAAFALLAETPAEQSTTLVIARGERQFSVALPAPRGCRSLVEIMVGGDSNARSDGKVIQLRYDFAAGLSDDQLAIIFAHELAHTVLEHRRRKTDSGIDNSAVMGLVGRNQQANRQAEVEADRLSVHLLANAGYDPAVIATFWRSPEGREAGGGTMPSWIYPAQSARADIALQEIEQYLPLRRGPTWPGHLLALRDRRF
ncbi:M48 family metallopeptidase [Aurantiacibacter sp. MUD11]|uniref:M48 family metallopeptidase n=1 Tax=Aurantiacibacter sp. MUD11 TaxID=3003265 RepID=UPI0022AA5DCA|nr:M48 family metallopeptidase [Aurantiacibacter sp. MUD11]WAT18302.1 M48 family metallopeptidase [Aurantiacibacter sp. MUD11]